MLRTPALRLISLAASLLIACACGPSAPSGPPASNSVNTGARAAPTTAPAAKPTTSAAAAPPLGVAGAAPTPAARQNTDQARRAVPAASPAAAPVARATAVACCSTGGSAVPNGKPYDSTFFENPGTNPFIDTLDDHLSTFGMDVDTAAYGIARRYLADNHLPEPASVRVEEYINSFDYHYPAAQGDQDFAIYVEGNRSPFNPRNELLQVGIQARQVDKAQRKPAALTFVIDTSSSMNIETRLTTVKRALRMLVAQMRPNDTVGIVTFGASARVVLPPSAVTDQERILNVIDNLATDGATSIDAGLGEGFRLADQAYSPQKINMVLLCTDGVANNGVTSADALLDKYRAPLQKGIQLSVFGFGMGNYNDVMLERLGDGGNGSYAYIDSLDEARRVFVENLTGTLQTIARDAKVQVDFNPDVVSRYRLLGYEDRDVADQDFRNDKVDGGEVGAGKSVTALFEITRRDGATGVPATVDIRYQTPDRARALEQQLPVQNEAFRSDAPSDRFLLASSAAQFAELLKHSFWARGLSMRDLAGNAVPRLAENQDPTVRELATLITKAATLSPTPTPTASR